MMPLTTATPMNGVRQDVKALRNSGARSRHFESTVITGPGICPKKKRRGQKSIRGTDRLEQSVQQGPVVVGCGLDATDVEQAADIEGRHHVVDDGQRSGACRSTEIGQGRFTKEAGQ